MKFTKLGENEIRCVLTEEEMVSFGICLDDILEKNVKSGKFFNEILSRAALALGESTTGDIRGCSAQISVLNDRSISILFHTRKESDVHSFAEKLKEARKVKDDRSFLVFFKDMDDAVSFCRAAKGAGHLVSRFCKNKKSKEYVLFILRYACDDKQFKKVRIMAGEFGRVNDGEAASKAYILENSEILISEDAFFILGNM